LGLGFDWRPSLCLKFTRYRGGGGGGVGGGVGGKVREGGGSRVYYIYFFDYICSAYVASNMSHSCVQHFLQVP